ncbi:error-prone DNA polymerase domain protein [Mycobacterium xenopi 4042]|uniref:Error-prone DNA polymerase domain protein n=1 Tax=Mycobacterium xenopi 4042 TaxID=1299334 RepID=X7YJ02_MYCXE|nr:error-prone DNA polymerase domain protein [Mycobacterium xenopi 4042]
MFYSAWFKLHHPAAFCAALLRAQPMGFYSPQSLVADARRHGVTVHGPTSTPAWRTPRARTPARRSGLAWAMYVISVTSLPKGWSRSEKSTARLLLFWI